MSYLDETLQTFLGTGRSPSQLGQEFQDIKAQASAFWQQEGFSTETGRSKENIKKNRYKDILPYDQTRVVLNLCMDEGQADYINANFIQGVNNKRCYIATQGPLAHTVLDFWRMIWEYEVKVIVMACREVEMGKKKCERYWPLEQEMLQFGPFSIVQIKEQELNPDVVLRMLSISFQKEERTMIHFQYIAWPDRGIPDNYAHFLEMIEHVRQRQGDDAAPICVHCSAGCGRTGVICTLEYVRHLLLQKSIPQNFSIFDIVLEMRKQRPSAVQTLEQYEFLYQAVAEMFRSTLAARSYENLKENRLPLYDDAVSVRRPAPLIKRSSVLRSISVPAEPTPELPPKMNDTYAVVNKFRRSGGPGGPSSQETRPAGSSPKGALIDPSGFGGLQASSLPASPIKRLSASPSCEYTRVNSTYPGDTSPQDSPLLSSNIGHGKMLPHSPKSMGFVASPVKKVPGSPQHGSTDSYEDVCATPTQDNGLGYNFRIGKPKGPRDPPAEWTRL